jgi:hypothetical protein
MKVRGMKEICRSRGEMKGGSKAMLGVGMR